MVEPAFENPRAPPPGPSFFQSPGNAPAAQEDPLHELRVRIPVDLHRQLLSLKILRGKSLAETVSSALDVYFAEHSRKVTDAPGERSEA